MQALMPTAQQLEPRDQSAGFYTRPSKMGDHQRVNPETVRLKCRFPWKATGRAGCWGRAEATKRGAQKQNHLLSGGKLLPNAGRDCGDQREPCPHSPRGRALTAAETWAGSLPLPGSPLSRQRGHVPHLLAIPLQQ